MVHRGNRSEKGKLKQQVRRYIYTTSYLDPIMAETVCRVGRLEVIEFACTLNAEVSLSVVPDVEKGLILSDSRGRGAFQ